MIPTEKVEIKCDFPLPTGCWFVILSPSTTLQLLKFFFRILLK